MKTPHAIFLPFLLFLHACIGPMIDHYTETSDAIGTYVFDPTSSEFLSEEDKLAFEKITLTLNSNGKYYFSKNIGNEGMSGKWLVEGAGPDLHIRLRPDNGRFGLQMSCCCDSKGRLFVIYKIAKIKYRNEATSIFFKKIKNN
jgi:hypothetical protein